MDLLIIVVVIIAGVFVCAGCGCFLFFYVFRLDRRRAVRNKIRIHYLPPPAPVTFDDIDEDNTHKERRKLKNKRNIRKIESRNVSVIMKGGNAVEFNHPQSEEHKTSSKQDSGENDDIHSGHESPGLIDWISSKLSWKRSSEKPVHPLATKSTASRDIEKGSAKTSNKSPKLAHSASLEEPESSTKKKRFISQDRLRRAEMRKSVVAASSTEEEVGPEIEEEIEYDPTPSLLDLESIRKQRVKSVLAERSQNRLEVRKQYERNGWEDVVSRNAGPPPNLVPDGYRLNEMIGSKLLSPDFLVYKRILYLWEMDGKADGWFIGTIVSASKMRDYNFNIKYDREETKNIFVDGVKPVNLQLQGDNAYGRRWVVLIRTAPGKFSKFIQ